MMVLGFMAIGAAFGTVFGWALVRRSKAAEPRLAPDVPSTPREGPRGASTSEYEAVWLEALDRAVTDPDGSDQ